MGWGACERALKLHLSRKGLSGKARAKTESGNPTFRDCRGARGNVILTYDKVRAPRLYPDPGQSRADRPVASVAIHRVTGGCEACTARKQAVRISSEIFYRCDADAFSPAEGSIRQRPFLRGRAGVAGVPSRGMFPRGLPRNRRELPISSHTKRNASYIGRYVTPRVDRRGHGEMASSLTTP
jgi:hypothetical protein